MRYIEGYVTSPGLVDFWRDVGTAFSRDFCNWSTGIVNEKNGTRLPMHDEGWPPRARSAFPSCLLG